MEKQNDKIEKKSSTELLSEGAVEISCLENHSFSPSRVWQTNADQTILLNHVAVSTTFESESSQTASKNVITLAVPDEQDRSAKL